MIKRIHSTAVLVNSPRGYFENFYTHIYTQQTAEVSWVDPFRMRVAMGNELVRYGGNIKLTKNKVNWLIRFPNNKDYTMFVLKWS